MRRRTLLPMLAVMFVALMSFMATTQEAAAQCPSQTCCTFKIDVNVPANCLPFNIHTFWANGFPPGIPINANGITTHGLPWACPPTSQFFGASINGLFPLASWNNPVQYNVNGCCLVIRIGCDINGCMTIHVRPC